MADLNVFLALTRWASFTNLSPVFTNYLSKWSICFSITSTPSAELLKKRHNYMRSVCCKHLQPHSEAAESRNSVLFTMKPRSVLTAADCWEKHVVCLWGLRQQQQQRRRSVLPSLPFHRSTVTLQEPDENLSLWFMGCHLQGNWQSPSLPLDEGATCRRAKSVPLGPKAWPAITTRGTCKQAEL